MIVHLSLPQHYHLQVTFAHEASVCNSVLHTTLCSQYIKIRLAASTIIAAVVGRLRISGNN